MKTTNPIRLISSMATRQLLVDLIAQFERASGHPVALESVGGVDAAKRVQAGEAFDAVVLASDVIDRLVAAEKVVARSKIHLAASGVAVAVAAGAPQPDIGSEEAVKQTVLAARSIGYSTGPSGVQLAKLFERWGIADRIADRIVQAPPGVPVGSLLAQGKIELGFQQLSELMNVAGIDLLGPLPPAIQITTTFSAGQAVASTQPDAVHGLLDFFASREADGAKRRNGMEPA